MTATADATAKFAALSAEKRLAIVNHLRANGEACVGEIFNAVANGVTAPAVSRHLRVLETAGIVTRRIDRQRRIVSLVPGAFDFLGEWAPRDGVQ